MELVEAQSPPGPATRPDAKTTWRCGHCRAVVDASDGRRLRCPTCGWVNAVPRRVYVVCERCNHGQRVRFSPGSPPRLCVSCAHTLWLREVQLTPLKRHARRHISGRKHVSRRESVVFTILLYALVLLFFLLWLMQQ